MKWSVLIILIFLTFFYPLQAQKVRVGLWEFYDVNAVPEENVWKNSKEILNGKDDDKNGYIDDVYGIGFNYLEQPVNHNFTPEYDTNYKVLTQYFHGTAIANIIAKNNPKVEIVGVGFLRYVERPLDSVWKANIIQRLQGKPEEDMQLIDSMFQTSIKYFKKQNVKVINISWYANYQFFVKFLKDLKIDTQENLNKMKLWMKLFHQSLLKLMQDYPDIFFVIAAGNDTVDVDKAFCVPANIDLPNTIIVGGLNKEGTSKASFSNYGEKVKVWATAEYETLKVSNDYILDYPNASGTSFAAPVVTAYVAQKIGEGYNFQEIKKDLIQKKIFISK